MRILVTGCRGQVAMSLIERGALHNDIEILPLGRPDLDLAETDTIAAAIMAAEPDAIISAAAHTAVDLAETETEAAARINGFAPGEIGRAAAVLGVPVVHLSTDYVFDGSKPSPYVETDPVAPLGVYGRTKLDGERLLAAATGNHAILRTAWVYSPFSKNFLKTMLSLAVQRKLLTVVGDQVGNPTSALDIADAAIAVARNLLFDSDPNMRGVFHMAGTGRASWADFAAEIFAISRTFGGPSAEVNPIPTSGYPTPAKRPANSQLDCTKLAEVHGVQLPDWKVSTKDVVRRTLAQEGGAGALGRQSDGLT
ncbi:dTDP-4-dehydrorhamnose reductase [Rhizobium sp. CG5]|uniref:dTDP-4-dehydrorhamnose reductase n=1 Tax=Rhizobium sp. CG5 TaxID=2726076 RepID=UPI00203330FF|nr:dTDP-4-dehydrorhamnose reductase [Rhizobium sp. CG5]MCM2476073.1 dTDP-4-dehydrorhamnose reductase [Rhizobium sp. CG5]